jgi:hypothetical protein
MIWRNVNRFSSDVTETRHDGHRVTHVRYLTEAEADPEVGPMSKVKCAEDGEVFTAFPEELTSVPDPER